MELPAQQLNSTASGRVEQVLARQLGLSRRVIVAWLKEGRVHDADGMVRKGDRMQPGQELQLRLLGPLGRWVPAQQDPLPMLACGEGWLALNKPAGMPSHPKMPFESGCALNHLVAHASACAEVGDDALQGGLVHRLDNAASGVLLAASEGRCWQALRKAFSTGQVRRIYRARVRPENGSMPNGAGEVRAPLLAAGSKVRIDQAGRDTQTLWRAIDDQGLLEIDLRSGHRHQIRVHLASLGWPIVGDKLYGGAPHSRLLLHCCELAWQQHVLFAAADDAALA